MKLFFCNICFTTSLCMKMTRPEEVPNLNEFLKFIVRERGSF